MSLAVDPIRLFRDISSKADPRTRNFPIVVNPLIVFPVILGYLYISKVAGPRWMAKRRPFEFPWLIRVYNLAMVVVNAWFLMKVLNYTYLSGRYSPWCQGISYSRDSDTMSLLNAGWWYILVRFADFFDTFFFILRKKFTHVSNLHVIHHAIVAFNAWFWFTFAPEGQPALGLCLNSFIHIVMYAYYLLSTFGPSVRRFLWWKKYLTTMQIAQFLIFIVHMSIPLFVDCGFPRHLIHLAITQTLLILVLFINFYVHAYIRPKKPKADLYYNGNGLMHNGNGIIHNGNGIVYNRNPYDTFTSKGE